MDLRKGDLVEVAGGAAEVLSVVANNEGGYDLVLRVAASRDELSRTVLRKGGPDERDEDKSTHHEDYESDDDEEYDEWYEDEDEE